MKRAVLEKVTLRHIILGPAVCEPLLLTMISNRYYALPNTHPLTLPMLRAPMEHNVPKSVPIVTSRKDDPDEASGEARTISPD